MSKSAGRGPYQGRDRVAALAAEHIAAQDFTGAAILGAHRGRVVIEHYAGMAGPGLAASADVLWPLASISKMFAVSTILRLVEQGRVSLNLRVCDVLSGYAGGMREEVRLRHLLTHTAGLIYESPEIEARLMAETTLDDLIAEMLEAPLQFRPGTSVAYADNHTLLAAHVVATRLARPFAELVRDETLTPMGLANTFFPTPPSEDGRTATVRGPLAEGTGGAMYNSRYARGLAHPAFAVTSTARDLMAFMLHFSAGGPRIHSAATIDAMHRNQSGLTTGDGYAGLLAYEKTGPRAWGYGWELQTAATPGSISDLASFSTFGHGGASGCQAFVDPDNDITVVILTNTHLRTGIEAWFNRLGGLANAMVAALTVLAPTGADTPEKSSR